jgi:hypothetical protein
LGYALAADAVLVLHLAFILCVAFGGFVVLWARRFAWLHLPALAWGVYVSLAGRACPLTPLEQALRRAAGEAGYAGGFIDHYLLALIYPPGLTPAVQTAIGVVLIAINAGLYLRAFRGHAGKD